MPLGEKVFIFYTIISVLFKFYYEYVQYIYSKTFSSVQVRHERALVGTVGQ